MTHAVSTIILGGIMKKPSMALAAFLLFAVTAHAQFLADISDSIKTDFGTYRPYTVTVTPDVPTYTVDPDLGNVANLSDFILNDNQKDRLSQYNFVFIPQRSGFYAEQAEDGNGYPEMYDIYIEAFDRNIPQFITTDAVLHTFHKLFDRSLLKIEETNLLSHLYILNGNMYSYFIPLYHDESDSLAQQVYGLLASYFAVGRELLGYSTADMGLRTEAADSEVTLIGDAVAYQESPLFAAYPEDYSQYQPRGHYTFSSDLEMYFRAMTWFGRQAFVLKDAEDVPKTDLTGAALYLAYMKQNNIPSAETWVSWDKIDRRVAFFVGQSDDLTLDDYIDYAEIYFGADIGTLSPSQFLDEAVLLDFIESADAYFANPQITTETPKGLRFLGQRFTPDTNVFSKMVIPYVSGRTMPKALDVMAALHCQTAYDILDYYDETLYSGYTEQLDSLKNHFASLPEEQWAENLYWNWLYCLMPLLTEKGDGFPMFMQNASWQRKELNTALGSWSELRHDTILYLKQAYTLSAGPSVENLHGYVEPNPWLYARLASLIDYMLEEFYWLEEDQLVERLTDLREMLLSLETISEKELTGGEYTDEEQLLILTFGESIGQMLTFGSEGFDYEYGDFWDQPYNRDDMAVIADVHTDLINDQCLEEGVGYPFRIAVVCPVGGELKICVGAVFSYYEFLRPRSERLTDETWRELLASDYPPQVPGWTGCFYDPSSSFVCGNINHEGTTGYLDSAREPTVVPRTFKISSVYPNPFNSTAVVSIDLPQSSELRVVVYNMLGQKVAELVNGRFSAGTYRFPLDATDLSNGVYFVHAYVEGRLSQVRRVVLVK